MCILLKLNKELFAMFTFITFDIQGVSKNLLAESGAHKTPFLDTFT